MGQTREAVHIEEPTTLSPSLFSINIAEASASFGDVSTLVSALQQEELLSPLRYPGGKRRLAPFIHAVLQANGLRPDLMVEPFAGGASASLYLLQANAVERIGLCDRDPLVAAFWTTVFYDTEWLVKAVGDVPITLEQWDQYKRCEPTDRRERALACLFLNRTSFSGIMSSGAGPLGGRTQVSKYKLGCRFPRTRLQERIRRIGAMRERVAFVHQLAWKDTLDLVNTAVKEVSAADTFIYLDPPFFEKADKLYRRFFDDTEHKLLRDALGSLDQSWLLSYDSVPKVAELYMTQTRMNLGAIYTASTAKGYKAVNEALVTNLILPVCNQQV